jgi:hypothetical protein
MVGEQNSSRPLDSLADEIAGRLVQLTLELGYGSVARYYHLVNSSKRVGKEPVVVIDISGMANYAKPA